MRTSDPTPGRRVAARRIFTVRVFPVFYCVPTAVLTSEYVEHEVSTSSDDPLVELGEMCRQARRHSGPGGKLLVQGVLAKLVGVNQVTISRLESGEARTSNEIWDRIRANLTLTEVESRRMEELRKLGEVGRPGKIRPVHMADYVKKLAKLELDAAEILCVHELRIPGPLQSDHFCHAMLGSAGRADVAPAVHLRQQRRKVFVSQHLRRFHCVLFEEAFHFNARLLGPTCVLDQIDFLLRLMRGELTDPMIDERTQIRLLPRDGAKPYPAGDSTILRFDGGERDLLYIEHPGGGDYHRAQHKVRRAANNRDNVLRFVLDDNGTVELLEQLRKEYADRACGG
jgi:Domain of unknown function (DUF5753)